MTGRAHKSVNPDELETKLSVGPANRAESKERDPRKMGRNQARSSSKQILYQGNESNEKKGKQSGYISALTTFHCGQPTLVRQGGGGWCCYSQPINRANPQFLESQAPTRCTV